MEESSVKFTPLPSIVNFMAVLIGCGMGFLFKGSLWLLPIGVGMLTWFVLAPSWQSSKPSIVLLQRSYVLHGFIGSAIITSGIVSALAFS